VAGARQWLEELIGSSIVNGCAKEERARVWALSNIPRQTIKKSFSQF
ncbi:hypothetical protein PanWU01x14_014650, partial [Parasponia andersonii]